MPDSPKVDSWMPMYVGDYLADTSRFTLEQHGAYLLLIFDYWRNGPPPDDDQVLARIVGADVKSWRRIAPAVREKFHAEGGRLLHKRVEEELHAAGKNAERRHNLAKVAAEARWARKKNEAKSNAPSNAASNAPSIPQALPGECPSPLPPPKNLKTLNPLSSSAENPPNVDVVPLVVENGKPSRLRTEAGELLAFLNERTRRHFRPTDTTLKPIMARLKEGFTVRECKGVIARKVRAWQGDDKMRQYLRPSTLFGAEKFAQYVGEVPTESEVANEA